MSYKKLFVVLLAVAFSMLVPGARANAAVWTDHYDASSGYSFAGEGISTITFDDWGYTGPGGRNAKTFAPLNGGFGELGQKQHVATLWPNRLTPETPQTILHDLTNTPVYPNANMDAQVNFYKWGYTTPGFDEQSDYAAYKAGDYSASTRPGCLFNNMLIDLDGDYLVSKNDMHFAFYDTFSYVDATGANPPQEVRTSLSFQPYPVSDAIGWCGSILASHPAALDIMAGQLTFDFVMDVYNGSNHVFMGSQVVPRFEMRSYGTLTVNVWAGSDLQTFSSNAVINNTNPATTDRWDLDPNFYSLVSFAGGGVLPDGVWVSADSYNADGSRKLNPNGTWNVTVVPAGTAGAKWHANAFAGYAFILRADGLRMLDWFNEPVYGPDPCSTVNCNDNNACTTDSCVGGVCVHTNKVCNDNNFCTTDTCNAATGACVYAPVPGCGLCAGQSDGTPCNDGNPCTLNDACSGQVCAGTPKNCDDGIICTTDSCDTAAGSCVHTNNTVSCDDGNACTTGDACFGGVCAGKASICNDGNICTTDSCDPASGNCVYAPNALSCNDGNACTTQDVCSGGICSGTAIPGCGAGVVDTVNNNFTMLDPTGALSGGTNDVHFTWDGTTKTSVAVSGQVANATLDSTCPFFGIVWIAHDVALYGPGTYSIYPDCPAGSPGCGTGAPITFTVGAGELGAHMLFNWGVSTDIDVVDIWVPKAVFGPSPLQTAGCSSNPANKVWDWMSKDWDGDGKNGYGMVDGPFIGFSANFNVMGVTPSVVDTANNNFTMLDPTGALSGGTNEVHFTWDGTKMTSVAVSGQVSNATLATTCPFFGIVWTAHDVAIYGPGTYSVYPDCPAGSPGCGTGAPVTFTVGAGELGAHMLFNWGVSADIDVVDIWAPKAAFGPSPLQTAGCSSNPANKVWDWMSKDWDGDGINGYGMVDGPFMGFNANFNVMGIPPGPSCPASCDDGNVCTDDSCDTATGTCVHTNNTVSCDDGNPCTSGDKCANGVCAGTGLNCNDNNACTIDTCNTATGTCQHTAKVCNDNNICTNDSCNTATGACVFTAKCNDNNACTTDTCDTATGVCAYTLKVCNDNNICTTDSCNTATGCVFTAPGTCTLSSTLNNFTMVDPSGKTIGGTNDVVFAWDGTKKTSVAASGQATNALITSTCPFQGIVWSAHDVAIYGPGAYTVYAGCASGSPGCGAGTAITFTVGANQLGAHMLFDWGASKNIDVVDVWTQGATFGPSTLWTGACGSQTATRVWGLMSSDWNGDGKNGYPMVDGPFPNFNANFNVSLPVCGCASNADCNDNNACTTDTCSGCTCNHTPIVCNDNNACTTDSCNTAAGCVFTPFDCCNDNNVCTSDIWNPATGCSHVLISCNDNNACTTDSCNPVTGCVSAPVVCNDYNACTTDACNTATGCEYTPNYTACPSSPGNNFTMIDPGNNLVGGTNDVVFAWDGTKKTSVAASGQVSNALLSSTCPFFGVNWEAHDATVYGPGTYTAYSGCAAGSPGCAAGTPITFTVNAGEIGIHMLFNWNGNFDIDVVNVMKPNSASSNMWTGACGSNSVTTFWTWASYDFNGDGINGIGMVDGPFVGMNANFNLTKVMDPCADAATRCNDNNVCTVDTCNTATGACIYTARDCNDNNMCTFDSCNTTSGACVHRAKCDDNNACTVDSCDPATGNCMYSPITTDDNNACTIDTCTPTGVVHTPIVCNDNNACTSDTCNTAMGCVFTPIVCNDNNACTTDTCNTATGCVFTPRNCSDNNLCSTDSCNTANGLCVNVIITCNDNNLCTTDSCNTTTGLCVYTPVVCNDNSKCTNDSCNPATGCVFTPISCDDSNACTTDICVASTGCVHTEKVCNDNNACTTDSCDTATGVCMYTPVANGTGCLAGANPGVCQSGTCVTSTCPKGSYKTVTLRGTGSGAYWLENQILTQFTVSGSGCILKYTPNSLTTTPGTVLKADWTRGTGPNPISVTWMGSTVPAMTVPYTITCPSKAGPVGDLVLSNTGVRGGKDTDTLIISVANK